MEKSIHTRLFAAQVSTREKRLTFLSAEKPEDHDALEQQIEKDLSDPSIDQAVIQGRIDDLQKSKHLRAGSNIADWQKLHEKAENRSVEIEQLKKVQTMSTSADADFKKIEDGIKGQATPDVAAIDLAREKITFALEKIAEISMNGSGRPHNVIAQTQAYNELITKIQSLDPENKIAFVPDGLGGGEDDKMLEAAKEEKEKTFKPGSALTVAVENYKKPDQLSQTKEINKQALIDAVTNRKEELLAALSRVASHRPQVVDAQKIIQEYLDQIKEIETLQNDTINGPAVAPSGAPSASSDVVPPKEAEKSEMEKLLAFFEELIKFLRGESMKDGDISALKEEVLKIDKQIEQIKTDNPKFSTNPELMKQITDLQVQRSKLLITIDEGMKVNARFVKDVNGMISRSDTPLYLRTAQDGQGNPYLTTTRNTAEARGHMTYMTRRLEQLHPGLGFDQRAGVGQGLYIHINGDVNINSNNTATNTVSGINNTGYASADSTLGSLGATLEGTAKNKVDTANRVRKAQIPVPPTSSLD